jgi:predicted Fe-S protein YdhL (DUF1289 family)
VGRSAHHPPPARSGPTLRSLCSLAGFEVDDATLSRLAERRINAGRKTQEVPDWSKWSPDERARLLRDCADEAARYGYDLDGSESLTPRRAAAPEIDLTSEPRNWHAASAAG